MLAELLLHPCIRGVPTRGSNSALATSPLPSRGFTRGRNCYVPPAFSVVPKKGAKIVIGYLNPSPSQASIGGRNCYVTPSRGPRRWRNCYITPTFSKIPKKGVNFRLGYLTPTFSGAHKCAKLLPNPCILGGPDQRGQIEDGLPQPCLPGGQQVAGIGTSPLHSGVPNKGDKITIDYLIPSPFRGSTSWRNCYITLAFSGVPIRGDKFKTACLTPTFSGAPQVGRIAMLRLHSRLSPLEGTNPESAISPLPSRMPTSGRNCYITLAFSGSKQRHKF